MRQYIHFIKSVILNAVLYTGVLYLGFVLTSNTIIEKNRVTELSGDCLILHNRKPISISNEKVLIKQVLSDGIIGFTKKRVAIQCNENKITYYKKLAQTSFSEL